MDALLQKSQWAAFFARGPIGEHGKLSSWARCDKWWVRKCIWIGGQLLSCVFRSILYCSPEVVCGLRISVFLTQNLSCSLHLVVGLTSHILLFTKRIISESPHAFFADIIQRQSLSSIRTHILEIFKIMTPLAFAVSLERHPSIQFI